MKFIEEILSNFEHEKVIRFKKSILNTGNNNQGKELEIIDQILSGNNISSKNKNAYHSNRKRLTNKLIDFLFSEDVSHQTTYHTTINKWNEVALYLFKNNMAKQAWFLLYKSEKTAIKHELYIELHQTYLMQIACILCEYAPPISEVIEKMNDNKKWVELDEKMVVSSKIIELELQKVILTSDGHQFEEALQKVSKTLKLEEGIISNPKFAFQFLSITRSIAKAQKTYYQFVPFVIQTYTTLLQNKVFESSPYKAEILYMICHALYRTRNFTLLQKYIVDFEQAISLSNTTHLQSKLVFIKAFLHCFTSNLEDAISLLNKNLNQFSTKENIITRLNLCIFYFLQKDYSSALRINRNIGHTDKWLEKNMGLEWSMKKHLMEIIIHFDLENLDLVENLIRSFNTKFHELLKLRKYQKVKPFIGFIKQGMQAKSFDLAKLENSLVDTPEEQEDLQAMMFYGWLKSKVTKKDFYKTLLEMI